MSFKFSSKTHDNLKEFKVADFLAQINADKETKSDAKCIKKIVFENLINAATMNTEEDEVYKIIYVIKLMVDEERIPKLFIESLDKVINFHTYFLIEYETKIASMVSFKEITNKCVKLEKYYSHNFAKDEDIELGNINSVRDVYKAILSYEMNVKARAEEDPKEYWMRVKAIKRIEYQISKTLKAIQRENQPKKKFEYNERLRKERQEYNKLLNVKENG